MGSNIMSDACSGCVSEQIAPVILKTLSQLLDEGDTKPLDIEQLNFCFYLMLGKSSPKMLEVYLFLAENTERIAQLKRAPAYSAEPALGYLGPCLRKRRQQGYQDGTEGTERKVSGNFCIDYKEDSDE